MERKFDLEIKIHGALFGFFTVAMVGIAGYSNLDLSAQIAFLCSVSIATVSGYLLLMLLMIARQYSRRTPEGKWRGDLYLQKLDGKPWLDWLFIAHHGIAIGTFVGTLLNRVVEESLLLLLLIPMLFFIIIILLTFRYVTTRKYIPEGE
ncbi:TPA: hypothetical protein PXO91_002158 [Yersinia enterocolitica]|nr:hypothetical protein [Yersinia enterocolitica]